jgi:Glycosyltransferase 61
MKLVMTPSIVNLCNKIVPINRRRAILNKALRYPMREWIFRTMVRTLGLNIATREEIFNNSKKYRVFQFGSKEIIKISEPDKGSSELPQFITDKINTFTLEQPYVAEVKNAELVGSTAVGFDRDGSLVAETVMPTGLKKMPKTLKTSVPTPTLILKTLPSLGVPQLEIACSLVTCWPRNYHNWITYCLTRIEGIEYYQKQTGKKPILILEKNPPKWKIESLKLLGYRPDDYIQWNGSRMKINQLVVPSFRNLSQIPQASACHWLRQRLVSNLPDVESKQSSFSSRIYISRPKTVGRNVTNEDEVLAALAPLGFVAYTMENLSFADQVRLFSQAEMVVAPHGAGLANIVFSQDLNVIELFSFYGTPAYFLIAKVLGFRYGCLASNPNPEAGKQYRQFQEIMVDIAKLRILVEEMLAISASQTQAEFSAQT